jgi:hypothetical protein
MNDVAPDLDPQTTGDGKLQNNWTPVADPFEDGQATLVWDAVARSAPRITDHLSGARIVGTISLRDCVTAFHIAAARGPFALFPELLASLISHFQRGAFASRARQQLIADVRALWKQCNDAAVAESAAAIQHRALAETLLDPWIDPPPPKWPAGILARTSEDTIAEIALADGVDMGAQAMAFVTAASAAADKQSRLDVYLNGRFMVPPVLWTMVLAESGMRKSPILHTAFAPIKRATGERWHEHRQAVKQFEALPAAERRNAVEPSQPPSLFVDDITPEKLAELLGAEPRGILMLKEELVALFDFGRYSSSSGAGARGFLVTCHDATETWFHRKSSGATHISNTAMTIFGCTQPARLAKFKDLEDDGLLQRFLIVRPARVSGGSKSSVHVCGLERLEASITGLIHRDAMHYQLSPAGAAMVRETERIGEDWERQAEAGLGFPAWVRKMHGQHARLALILHLMEMPAERQIADDVVERAGRLMLEYLLPNAYSFYCALPDSGLALLRSAAGWLLTKAPTRFTSGNVQQGVAACARKPLKFIQDVLDPLVTGGWLEPETEYPTNRAWTLIDGVREAFAERRKAERERRAALAALVRGQRCL